MDPTMGYEQGVAQDATIGPSAQATRCGKALDYIAPPP